MPINQVSPSASKLRLTGASSGSASLSTWRFTTGSISVTYRNCYTRDISSLAGLPDTAQLAIPLLRACADHAAFADLLRILLSTNAAALSTAIRQLTEVTDNVQTLFGYLATNEALEWSPHLR